eukprot:CAMPEP_0170642846 /NCGR_PEP_ID=MMETSP0224-20130122/41551_1 /TAXON_ID=285029 /ORGANISM="Togula jolla, Strain CCCM 725" /LENGTH=112 /DNA_ID=CAMNT_0010973597 /DNA_START=114 /DNA_END=452 /DNA_ORIENTATION=+
MSGQRGVRDNVEEDFSHMIHVVQPCPLIDADGKPRKIDALPHDAKTAVGKWHSNIIPTVADEHWNAVRREGIVEHVGGRGIPADYQAELGLVDLVGVLLKLYPAHGNARVTS